MQTRVTPSAEAIVVGIGGNLSSPVHGTPLDVCRAAIDAVASWPGIVIVGQSRWYESAPVPPSDQGWYVNGVAVLDTDLPSSSLMQVLHEIETDFGRKRRVQNEARVIDLDLLAHGRNVAPPPAWPVLPHPRLATRAFVLLPLFEVLPDWRHPESGATLDAMIADLPTDQVIRVLDT